MQDWPVLHCCVVQFSGFRTVACTSHHPPAPLPHDLSPFRTQVFASALATWQLGVINAPTNKGLKPKKFNLYDLDHYYQVGCHMQLALQVARRAGLLPFAVF